MWFLIKDLVLTEDAPKDKPKVIFIEAPDRDDAVDRAEIEFPYILGWQTIQVVDNLIQAVAWVRASTSQENHLMVLPLPSTPESSLRALYRLTDG